MHKIRPDKNCTNMWIIWGWRSSKFIWNTTDWKEWIRKESISLRLIAGGSRKWTGNHWTWCAEQLLKVSLIKERVEYILANIFEVTGSRKDSIGNEELTQAGIYKCSIKIFIEFLHVPVQGAVGRTGRNAEEASSSSKPGEPTGKSRWGAK